MSFQEYFQVSFTVIKSWLTLEEVSAHLMFPTLNSEWPHGAGAQEISPFPSSPDPP